MKDLLRFFFLGFLLAGAVLMSSETKALPDRGPVDGPWELESASDAETLHLKNGRTVRLLGVDCAEIDHAMENEFAASKLRVPVPDYQAHAVKAKERTQEMLKDKELYIERDPRHKDVEYEDHHGRDIGYVYAGDKMLNQTLIEEGLCHAPFGAKDLPHKYREAFELLQKQAMENHRGLWQEKE